jgi:pantothenate synthetase
MNTGVSDNIIQALNYTKRIPEKFAVGFINLIKKLHWYHLSLIDANHVKTASTVIKSDVPGLNFTKHKTFS